MTQPGYDPTRRRGRRTRKAPRAARPCIGYAFRIEALRRVIEHSDTYIARFTRRLARREAAARINDPILLPDAPPGRRNHPVRSPSAASTARSRNAKHVDPG
jgi:hypothetical protein